MSTDLIGGFDATGLVPFERTDLSEDEQASEQPDILESCAARVLIPGDRLISPYGVIVVDPDLRIMGTNQKARHFLAAEQGISVRSGKLHLARAYVMRRIKETVQRKMASTPLHGLDNDPAIVGVPDSENRIRYAVRVGSAVHPPGNHWVRLVVAELIDGNEVSRSELSSVFGLSEREAELAEWFSKGMRVEQIAPAMGVSLNTARMHLRHVFQKCGCCTQVQLARVIARVP